MPATESRISKLSAWAIACGAAAFFLVSCAPHVPDEDATLQFGSLVWNSLERTYAVYTPAAPRTPAPVVLLLHGGLGSADSVWESENGRSWRALADKHGFILVLPEGRPDPSNADRHHWNDCRADIDNEDAVSAEDDVGYIDALIDWLEADVAVDPARIYVTGASNGGMMTFRLAMQLGGRFAAAAAVIANLPDPSECPFEAAPLPILIMNGTADPLIPYEGGCVAGAACRRGRVRSTDDTVTFWVDVNDAEVSAEEITLPDRVAADGSTVTVFSHRGGSTGKDVVLYRIDGGGHAVPGPDSSTASLRAAARKNRDIDAAKEIWRFFDKHARPSG
jgi:polyhydroxybutyrate depolymerase